MPRRPLQSRLLPHEISCSAEVEQELIDGKSGREAGGRSATARGSAELLVLAEAAAHPDLGIVGGSSLIGPATCRTDIGLGNRDQRLALQGNCHGLFDRQRFRTSLGTRRRGQNDW